jgi:hypothetical protein
MRRARTPRERLGCSGRDRGGGRGGGRTAPAAGMREGARGVSRRRLRGRTTRGGRPPVDNLPAAWACACGDVRRRPATPRRSDSRAALGGTVPPRCDADAPQRLFVRGTHAHTNNRGSSRAHVHQLHSANWRALRCGAAPRPACAADHTRCALRRAQALGSLWGVCRLEAPPAARSSLSNPPSVRETPGSAQRMERYALAAWRWRHVPRAQTERNAILTRPRPGSGQAALRRRRMKKTKPPHTRSHGRATRHAASIRRRTRSSNKL